MVSASPSDRDVVSVVLPYFDRQDTLEASAQSVLAQTHEDLLLYLVNDGSTDNSRRVARSITDRRVRHIDAERNSGACVARNLGLEAAETELVAFQDSDDVWLPNKLARQVHLLRAAQSADGSVSVFGCGWRYDDGRDTQRAFSAGPFTRMDVLRGVAGTGTPMLLVDRTKAAEAFFDPRFPSLEERDFLLSCLANGSQVGVAPEVLAFVRRGRSDHVANPSRTAVGWELLIDKYAGLLDDDPALASWYRFRAAREHLVARQPASVLPHLKQALRHHRVRRSVHLGLGLAAGAKGLAFAQKLAGRP